MKKIGERMESTYELYKDLEWVRALYIIKKSTGLKIDINSKIRD